MFNYYLSLIKLSVSRFEKKFICNYKCYLGKEGIFEHLSMIYRYISNYKLYNKSSMDIASSLHQDSTHGVTDLDPETSCQDPQKTCTRNSPCLQQECMICSTPNNHILNLDVTLNSSNATPTSPTTADSPQPPD